MREYHVRICERLSGKFRWSTRLSIYTKGKQRAAEIGNKVFLFLKNKLQLPINMEKSGICNPGNFRILGYSFVPVYEKGAKGRYQLVVSEKSWKRLKAEIKEVTRKTSPLTIAERISKLKLLQRGWLNYFRLASITAKIQAVDSWVRNRLRYCIWHDWKKPDRRRKNLIRLGVPQGKAYTYSRSRKGGWAIAQSPILNTTVTLERLRKRGYESAEAYYQKVGPMFNEPLYTRPVCIVV